MGLDIMGLPDPQPYRKGYTWVNPGKLIDRFGKPVDTTTGQWRLNDPSRSMVLNWDRMPVSSSLKESMKAYLAHLIESNAPHSVDNAFECIRYAARMVPQGFDRGSVTYQGLETCLTEMRNRGMEWRFHWIRNWYCWCADARLPGFDESTQRRLIRLRVRGNAKGEAVLSSDPDEGPLDEYEHGLLRQAVKADKGDRLSRVCVMLCLELGANPKNLVLLEERDFKVIRGASGDNVYYSLAVPSIKKRQTGRETRTRKISINLGQQLERLIEENYQRFGREFGDKTPILHRPSGRKRETLSDSMVRFGNHLTTHEFSRLIRDYSGKAAIVSPRTGSMLALSPRRLRYTFATKMAEQGVPPAVLADLLDHTDLQHVGVYYKGRAKLVERLDEALGKDPHYPEVIDRFLGKIVSRQEVDDPQQRVYGKTPTLKNLGGIGVCGATGLCNLYPPLSCYLCPKFQAWEDGPHQEMLGELQEYARELRERSGNPSDRIPHQLDEVIQGIAALVRRLSQEETSGDREDNG